MSDCCKTESDARPKGLKMDCPQCGQRSLEVPLKTMLHHVKQAWVINFFEQHYFYCRDPECDVVYFAADGSTITKSSIRTLIGIKEESGEALVCFCFGVSRAEAASNKEAKVFVIQQTKMAICSCETANPSGRCCLKDFPKQV